MNHREYAFVVAKIRIYDELSKNVCHILDIQPKNVIFVPEI